MAIIACRALTTVLCFTAGATGICFFRVFFHAGEKHGKGRLKSAAGDEIEGGGMEVPGLYLKDLCVACVHNVHEFLVLAAPQQSETLRCVTMTSVLTLFTKLHVVYVVDGARSLDTDLISQGLYRRLGYAQLAWQLKSALMLVPPSWYDVNARHTSVNCVRWKGVWDNGQLTGQATVQYNNGDRYTGGFERGLRSGEGTMFAAKSG